MRCGSKNHRAESILNYSRRGQTRMAYVQSFKKSQRYFINCAATIAAIFLLGSSCSAQTSQTAPATEMPWAQELKKYPGLLPELGRLVEKLQQNLQFPPERAESRLLPLLPPSTMSYAAFPNYGDVTQQARKIFDQELQESSVLRDWWTHGALAADGSKLEAALDHLYQFHQYLGDEIVVSGAMDGHDPKLLVIAEVRKPGLKKFLQERLTNIAGASKSGVRLFDPQELAAAKEKGPSQELLVLVRPDFVVAASDLATLRSFSARLDHPSREFASTPFGQRVAQEYHSSVAIIAAADLHKIMNQFPSAAEQDSTLQRSGFADMSYLVWEHKTVAGQSTSQMELSFSAPRHGSASWLAKTGPVTNLDFVSPKAMLATTVLLASPSQIFEDLKALLATPKSNTFASLAAFEQILKISLKDDLLHYLSGELTVELDSVAPPQPVWKAILKVNDAVRLQQTLSTLLAAAHFETQQFEEGDVTYHTFRIPNEKAAIEIAYAFVDGHLIVASSQPAVAEAAALHASGGSLAKSQKFLASLPAGHTLASSVLVYQDPIAMATMQLRQQAPQLAEVLAQLSKTAGPTVTGLYADETTIREASGSGTFDVGAALVVAAIAIPNLLRSRIAANEASAVGSVRTMNTAEITYAATYPKKGFARDLATLGSDPHNLTAYSPEHAGLLDDTLANETCTANAWCTKSGYRFRLTGLCKLQPCKEYVAIATPAEDNSGTRSFCSASDAVIRYKLGAPLASTVTAAECKLWPPLQ